MHSGFTMVLRNGKETRIQTDEVVVGDVLQCTEGDIIPADAQIIVCNDLGK
ncbi:MAG: hypothetical protein R2794_12860 [Chitinophagales bacterium]